MTKGKTLAHLKGTTNMNDGGVMPIMNAMMTHGIVRESQVDILYMKDKRDRRLIRVKVWSKVRKNLFRYTDILVQGNSRRQMTAKCGIAAGAIAEQLIALYGDTVEPSECAKSAGKHFEELCVYLETRNARDAPEAPAPVTEKFTADNLRKLGETETIEPAMAATIAP